MYDHVLILAYGQPSSAGEIKPFLESQIKAKELAPERLLSRMEHFQKATAAYAYSKSIVAFGERLEKTLMAFGIALPVYTGARHMGPSLKDAMDKIKKKRHTRGLALILEPFKCELTYERYQETVKSALAAAALTVQYDYLTLKNTHLLFCQALADKARMAMRTLSVEQREFVHVVFTAPSITRMMSQLCDYEKEVNATCSIVIKDLAQPKWSICYHSAEQGKEAWIDPDFTSLLTQFNKEKERHVLFVPVAAIVENIETLHDLDVEARKKADVSGYAYSRSGAVMEHPKFMLSVLDSLIEKIKK